MNNTLKLNKLETARGKYKITEIWLKPTYLKLEDVQRGARQIIDAQIIIENGPFLTCPSSIVHCPGLVW